MSAITTHVLDTSRGVPAAGVAVLLEMLEASGAWHPIGRGATDTDGRLRTLMPEGEPLQVGVYRLTFNTVQYFEELGLPSVLSPRRHRVRNRTGRAALPRAAAPQPVRVHDIPRIVERCQILTQGL